MGVIQDVTLEIRTQKSVITIKQDLKNFEDSINRFLIVAKTDPQGVITFANKKFCKISGYSTKELIGKTHRVVNSGFHPKDFFKKPMEYY